VGSKTRTWVTPQALADKVEGRTLVKSFRDAVQSKPTGVALRWRDGDDWPTLTWGQYAARATAVAAGLRRLGVGRGDRVSLLIKNRPEMQIIDTACLLLGATPTSIYYTNSGEQILFQLDRAASKVLVCDAGGLDRALAARAEARSLSHLLCVDEAPAGSDVLRLEDVEGDERVDLDEAAATVTPDDIATIIFTSGTTGPPKGVLLSHRNVEAAVQGQLLLFGEGWSDKRVINYLPMAHVADRVMGHWMAIISRYEVTTCPDPQKMAEYLVPVRPHIFFGPPRIWEKLYAAIQQAARAETGGDGAFARAIDVGRQVHSGGEVSDDLKAEWQAVEPQAKRWLATVGLDALEIAYTSAAAVNEEVLDAFQALGTPLVDGYGMSENTTLCAGDVYEPRRGSVGRAMPGVELRLADDGEILTRSPANFTGYLDDPEKTREAIDDEGWLHTGDVGELDEDGYLRIVDRKKDLIITSGGKNVAPALIESMLVGSPLVGQAVAIGESRKFVTALLVLDPLEAPSWAQRKGVEFTSLNDLAEHPDVIEELGQHVDEINERLSRVEQVKKFTVLAGPWMPDSDELTALMKLKRRSVTEKYAEEIEKLYG
jgi:long-subunit acyl-CoA synthetase (AMP-forming)